MRKITQYVERRTNVSAAMKRAEQMVMLDVLRRRVPTVIYHLDEKPRNFPKKPKTKNNYED